MNKSQHNKWQREYRKLTGNACTIKYEKTPKGFLMRKYRNMQSRVTGIQKLKKHLYLGKKLLPREQYYEWAINNKMFWKLYNKWKKNNYERKLCPTVERINSKLGYELSNMEWITHSENSRRGSINRRKKKI
jgi:hypothetical protein